MKKLLVIALLMLALVITAVACQPTTDEPDTSADEVTTAETPTEAPTDEPSAPESDPETPAPETDPETPAPETDPETPAPETEPETPAPETEPETKDPMEPVNVFDADDISGMTGMKQIASVEMMDGYLHVVPGGTDPYWYPFSAVDGARYVAVRYRTADATGANMQIFIGSTGNGPTNDDSMTQIPLTVDGEWNLAIFDTQAIIDKEMYDGSFVSYFRFDVMEAGYVLDENGEPFKDENNNWVKYPLPEGCSIDIAYIGFFLSAEAAAKYDFENYPPYVEADDPAAGKKNHSFDTFYVNNQMYFPEDGGAGDKLTAQDNTITFAEGEAHDSMILRGWVGFDQPIDSFGYFLDNYEFVFNPDYTKPTEDGVKAAGGEHASRFEIYVPLADLMYDDHFAGFVVKLADGTIVRLRENITVSLPAAPKQDDHNFTSDVASNFASAQNDVDWKASDLAGLFDIVYGQGDGVPAWVKYNGGDSYYSINMFNAAHTQPNGQYAYNVNIHSTAGHEGQASMFVRGYRLASIENNFFGQDGNDGGAVISMGGAGIYINYVPRGTDYALRINVKTYVDGKYIPNVYYTPVNSSDITVTDDGSTVSIFAGDKLAATIVISGVKDYGISTDHGTVPAEALAEKAVITTADGTFELENACVAATLEDSYLGVATRTGTFNFSELSLQPYNTVEIPTDFYVPVVRENVAAGKPVTSDNVENEQNIPANATDGDLNTRYGALPNGVANLIVDLEKVYTLTGMDISFENALWKYEIAVSEDGVDYTVIHESESHGATTKNLELDNVAARYIKFTRLADDSATHYWFSIYEVYVYAVAEEEPETPDEPTPEEPAVENYNVPQSQWVITGHNTQLNDASNGMVAAGGVESAALLHQGSIALGEVDLSKYSKVVVMWGCDNSQVTIDHYNANANNRIMLLNAEMSMVMSPAADTIIAGGTYELKGWAVTAFEIDLTGIDYNGPVWLAIDALPGTFALVASVEFVA